MCSIIGKGDKLETMINELSDELEESKEREKLKDKEMKEVLEDLKKLVSEQSDRIKKIEEKFEKTFSEQRREIDNILEKVAEVDFNRHICNNYKFSSFNQFLHVPSGEITWYSMVFRQNQGKARRSFTGVSGKS